MVGHFNTKPQPPLMLPGKNNRKGMTWLYHNDDNEIFGSPKF